jgi:nucleotidyltransferase/DNA polymerase involved in DNA repair
MLLCVSVAADWLAGDEMQTRGLWEEILDALDAVSPLIDDVRPGLAFLDMHGIGNGARTWMAQTRSVLEHFGCALRLGAGPNKIAALAAAHIEDGSICEPGAEGEMLAPLPLALLDIEPATIERLRLLGIERLGELARLPHGPFVRRFGAAAAVWHELARGIDRRPFIPRAHAVAIEASIFGQGHAADETQVFFALRMLLARICADLDCCGKRAGALHLAIQLEDADTCGFDVPLAIPTAQERSMFDMLRAKLEGATFAAPIVGLRLQALQLEEGGEAQVFFTADDFDSQRVAVTIARLEAVLGERIVRAKTRDAHLLEERFVYERFELPVRTMFAATPKDACSNLVPQLRLLQVREVSVQLRGGEPAIVDRQAVRQCAGPWRISERSYTPSPVTRDEYDVALEDGTFARIYRQGSHWYLRGVYE